MGHPAFGHPSQEGKRIASPVKMGSFCAIPLSPNRIDGDSEASIGPRRVGPSSDPPLMAGLKTNLSYKTQEPVAIGLVLY